MPELGHRTHFHLFFSFSDHNRNVIMCVEKHTEAAGRHVSSFQATTTRSHLGAGADKAWCSAVGNHVSSSTQQTSEHF